MWPSDDEPDQADAHESGFSLPNCSRCKACEWMRLGSALLLAWNKTYESTHGAVPIGEGRFRVRGWSATSEIHRSGTCQWSKAKGRV